MNKKKEFIERLAALQAQEPELKRSKLDLIDQQGLGTKAEAGDVTHTSHSHNKPFVYENTNNEHTGVERGVVATKDVKLHFENGDSKKKNVTGNGNDCTGVTDLGLKLDSLVDLYFLNKSIFNLETQSLLHEKFSAIKDSSYTDAASGVKLSGHPFRHCVLPDFISNDTFINNLESVLQEISLRTKNNDLYKFLQSGDLTCSKNLTISKFRSLCENLKSFISHVTGIPLNNKMDLFCSQYKYTDVLLCHDDELEERRIAFIYYLVPNSWSASDGGTLDLFDSDEKIQPKNVVKSIVPTRNTFLFFEVSEISFHQVAEVLSETKTRLSLSGWFHGPPLARQPQPLVDTLPPAVPFGSIEEEVFYAWFNPLYLAPEVQTDVRSRFEADSEIELTDFLQEDKYQALMAALQENNINWELTGPANKRHYYLASKDNLPAVVSEFLRVMHSDAAFLVLSNLTGLKLHPLAPSSDDDEPSQSSGECSMSESVAPCQSKISCPRCRSEVRKWQHGCYTLAHDTDAEIMDFALDVIMYVGSEKDWNFDNGGYTSYIAKGEDEELLSICPAGNSLALVYRDKDTMRFVKHLNHRVTKLPTSCFYEINTVYYE